MEQLRDLDKCEACGKPAVEFVMTEDDVRLCPTCAEALVIDTLLERNKRIGRLLDLLRKAEWSNDEFICPWCGGWKPVEGDIWNSKRGHRPDCPCKRELEDEL